MGVVRLDLELTLLWVLGSLLLVRLGSQSDDPISNRARIVARSLWRLLRPTPPTASKEVMLHTGTIMICGEWTLIMSSKPFLSDPPPSYPSRSLQPPYQAHTRVFSNETSSMPHWASRTLLHRPSTILSLPLTLQVPPMMPHSLPTSATCTALYCLSGIDVRLVSINKNHLNVWGSVIYYRLGLYWCSRNNFSLHLCFQNPHQRLAMADVAGLLRYFIRSF